jgi:hypothetical protein
MYRHVVQNSSHRRQQIRVLWDVVALVFDFPVAVCGNPIGETGRQRIAPLAMASICGRISQSWNDGRRLVPTTRSISLGHTLNFRELDHGRGGCDKACVIPATIWRRTNWDARRHFDCFASLSSRPLEPGTWKVVQGIFQYSDNISRPAHWYTRANDSSTIVPSTLFTGAFGVWDSQWCIRTPFS